MRNYYSDGVNAALAALSELADEAHAEATDPRHLSTELGPERMYAAALNDAFDAVRKLRHESAWHQEERGA